MSSCVDGKYKYMSGKVRKKRREDNVCWNDRKSLKRKWKRKNKIKILKKEEKKESVRRSKNKFQRKERK